MFLAPPRPRRGPSCWVFGCVLSWVFSWTFGFGTCAVTPLPAQGQYKRIHQRLLKQILDGKFEAARNRIQKQLATRPDDGETYFVQTVLEAAEDNTTAALSAMGKALEAGLSPGRFVAGPRPLFAPIADTEIGDIRRRGRPPSAG